MKKTFSILVMLMIVSSVVFARRLDTPTTGVAVMKNGETFKLLYKGTQNSNVKVLILNDNNEIVFSERIKNTDGFVRPYNFTALPEGNYRFEVTDSNGLQSEQINYRKPTNDKVAHLIRVAGTDEKFILSVPNRGNDIITVTIFDEDNAVLYSGIEKITGDFAKVYNVQKLEGKATFNVTDSKGFSKSLTK